MEAAFFYSLILVISHIIFCSTQWCQEKIRRNLKNLTKKKNLAGFFSPAREKNMGIARKFTE